MLVKLWICSECETPCVHSYDPEMYILKRDNKGSVIREDIEPDTCSYAGYDEDRAEYKLLEVEAEELLTYFAKPCKHYELIQMCKGRGGICPKECDGDHDLCLTKEGIQRGMRVK